MKKEDKNLAYRKPVQGNEQKEKKCDFADDAGYCNFGDDCPFTGDDTIYC